jgi:hypothetical protein
MRIFVASCAYLGIVSGTVFTFNQFEQKIAKCDQESTQGILDVARDCIMKGTP